MAPNATRRCPDVPSTEPIFNALVGGLFREGAVPKGSIIDVGALEGTFACFYAELAPDRLVHALDPLKSNVDLFAARYARTHPNLRPMVGALGERRGVLRGTGLIQHKAGAFALLSGLAQRMPMPSSSWPAADSHDEIAVHVADELFDSEWRGEALGFAHIDVEGSELQVLRGLARTIRSSQPIFSVELHVHYDRDFTRALLSFVEKDLGYLAYLIEETCGTRMDCRNLLAFPRSFEGRGRRRSHMLDLAKRSRVLVPVSGDSIFEHAYPCCRPGGECCRPRLRLPDIASPLCCTWNHVKGFLSRRMLPFREAWASNKSVAPLQPWVAHAAPWTSG